MNKPNLQLEFLANGVRDKLTGRFFPYRTRSVTQASVTLTPRTNGNRFFVKSAALNVRTIAADTTQTVYLVLPVINQSLTVIMANCTPSVAERFDIVRDEVNLLGDPGQSMTLTFIGGDPTSARCLVTVAEVDDIV